MTQENISPDGPTVILAVDESTSDEALLWAIDEARSRAANLRVVHAYVWEPSYLPVPGYTAVSPPDRERVRRAAEQTASAAIERLRKLDLSDLPLTIVGSTIEEQTVPALVETSKSAELLVLGSRREGPLRSFLLGSVGCGTVARAHCPVVVVRGPVNQGRAQRVVVGIADHGTAADALTLAFRYAERHHVPLRAVYCWRSDPLAAGDPPPWVHADQAARQLVTDVIRPWTKEHPNVEAEAVAIMAHPVTGLIDQTDPQSLLVIGRRGRHALIGTLLGSVSQGVLHHATCAVAVCPPLD
jgi:nucleotide-binding universal stress UspA family protein